MYEIKALYITDLGNYAVQIEPIGYAVRRVPTGELIAICTTYELARTVADSREWTDECDAAEERDRIRGRRDPNKGRD